MNFFIVTIMNEIRNKKHKLNFDRTELKWANLSFQIFTLCYILLIDVTLCYIVLTVTSHYDTMC